MGLAARCCNQTIPGGKHLNFNPLFSGAQGLYFVYQIVVGLLFYLSFPFLLLLVLITGKHREGLGERLGFLNGFPPKRSGEIRIWVHAASVGEVRAAGAIIASLRERLPHGRYFLSTMTIHGKKVAVNTLPPEVICFLAPLDVPLVVDRVLGIVDPDVYVCIETEIWPLLIHKVVARGAKCVLVNGRMSEKSFNSYKKIRRLITSVLRQFQHIAVITETDYSRYFAMGAAKEALSVEGNVKYDLKIPDDADSIRERYRSLLQLKAGTEILITGSTHGGEEELFLPLYKRLAAERDFLWVLAPRHLQRVWQIEAMFAQMGVAIDRFSDLLGGGSRAHGVVLVDTLGDLAGLYAVADFVFCGGSLVERGGHNVMEAAIWGKPVFFGPSMGDFRDAADLLESAQAGFPVVGIEEIEERIRFFRSNPAGYQNACRSAAEVAQKQRGAAKRLQRIILRRLEPEIVK